MKNTSSILCSIALLSCIIMLAGCSSFLTSRVRAMEKAHNLHQLDKELSFYADDTLFSVDDWTVQGKNELNELFTVDILLNGSLAFGNISVAGNTVVCKAAEKNDFFRAMGLEAIYYDRCEMIFKSGRIRELKATTSAQSIAEMDKADQAFAAWADKNRPEEVARLLGGKPFEKMTPETALGWLKLAREWSQVR